MADLFSRKKKDAPAEPEPLQQFVPKPAAVNIIPRGVLSGYKVKAVRTRFVAAAIFLVLILGGVYGANIFLRFGEDERLENLLAQAETVRNDAAKLTPYQIFYNDVERKRNEIGEQMATDVAHGEIFEAIHQIANQNGVNLTSVSLNVSGGGSKASCPSPDPWNSADTIGCISFEGRTGDRANIAAFVNALNGTEGFVNAYVPSSSVSTSKDASGSVSSVSGTVSFASDFFTGRFSHLTLPLNTVLSGDTSGEGEEPSTDGENGTEGVETDDNGAETTAPDTTGGETGDTQDATTSNEEN